jgi:hypothetical protein
MKGCIIFMMKGVKREEPGKDHEPVRGRKKADSGCSNDTGFYPFMDTLGAILLMKHSHRPT